MKMKKGALGTQETDRMAWCDIRCDAMAKRGRKEKISEVSSSCNLGGLASVFGIGILYTVRTQTRQEPRASRESSCAFTIFTVD